MNRLTDAELTEARLNLAKARTSLECEPWRIRNV